MTLFIFQVVPSDAGRYVCTLETFPKKSLFLLLQVNGDDNYDISCFVKSMVWYADDHEGHCSNQTKMKKLCIFKS